MQLLITVALRVLSRWNSRLQPDPRDIKLLREAAHGDEAHLSPEALACEILTREIKAQKMQGKTSAAKGQ
jgi:hypothetical protein